MDPTDPDPQHCLCIYCPCSPSDTVDGDTEKRLAEEGEGEEERLAEESSSVAPNQTDGGSAESDTGYASMGDTGASEVAQSTLTRTRYGSVHYCAVF